MARSRMTLLSTIVTWRQNLAMLTNKRLSKWSGIIWQFRLSRDNGKQPRSRYGSKFFYFWTVRFGQNISEYLSGQILMNHENFYFSAAWLPFSGKENTSLLPNFVLRSVATKLTLDCWIMIVDDGIIQPKVRKTHRWFGFANTNSWFDPDHFVNEI